MNKKNNLKSQEKKLENKKRNKPEKIKKIALVFVLSLFVVVLLGYGTLILVSYNKSLPRLCLMGNDIGLQNKEELESYVKKIADANLDRIIDVSINGKVTEKAISDFKVELDSTSTAVNVIDFGKSYETFPNFIYFKKIFSKDRSVSPIYTWEGDTESILSSLLNSKKDPEGAKFSTNDQGVFVEGEKLGYEINLESFKKSLERCLSEGCSEIRVTTKAIPSDITSSKLSSYLADIIKTIQGGMTLNASEKYKKFTLSGENLIGFVDYDKTIENKALWWSQDNIETYLKENVSPKVDTSGKTRKISSYDGSIISEGSRGYGLQIEQSAAAIKNALINGENSSKLSIGVTEIKDEYVSPGFTPSRVESKYIDVNLSQQMLYALEGDKLIGSYRVSTGKWSMPTPVGQYSINSKQEMAFSATYKLYMPYWMAFIGQSYGIHELPETVTGRKEGSSSLGVPVSHGCIRLGVGDAKTVYDWAEVGTPIFIHK